MKIVLASDQIGLALKEGLKSYLDSRQISYEDFSLLSEASVDYPHIAERTAKAILAGKAERGLLISATGQGMCIVANKFAGIRAVACSEPYSAILSRRHHNSNILCLGAQVISTGLATLILEGWLSAAYEGETRQRHLDMITRIEQRNIAMGSANASSVPRPDLELTRRLEQTQPLASKPS